MPRVSSRREIERATVPLMANRHRSSSRCSRGPGHPGLIELSFWLSRAVLVAAQNRDELQHLRFAQRLIPGRHTRPADTVLNDVKILVLRHVRRILEERRNVRVKRTPELAVRG